MGTICILLGLIVLVAFAGGGFFISHIVLSSDVIVSLWSLQDPTKVYLYAVGGCALIGLLLCLPLVMSGVSYNRSSKNRAMIKRLSKH